MRIIGERYIAKRKLGEMNTYRCSECGAEYTHISAANACQSKHFDDRQKKEKVESTRNMAALEAPSMRTKPKISVKKTPSPLPPEDDDNVPVLTVRKAADDDGESDLQGLADRLLEQYK